MPDIQIDLNWAEAQAVYQQNQRLTIAIQQGADLQSRDDMIRQLLGVIDSAQVTNKLFADEARVVRTAKAMVGQDAAAVVEIDPMAMYHSEAVA